MRYKRSELVPNTPPCMHLGNLVTNFFTCHINIQKLQFKQISQENPTSKIGLSLNCTTDNLPARLYYCGMFENRGTNRGIDILS